MDCLKAKEEIKNMIKKLKTLDEKLKADLNMSYYLWIANFISMIYIAFFPSNLILLGYMFNLCIMVMFENMYAVMRSQKELLEALKK